MLASPAGLKTSAQVGFPCAVLSVAEKSEQKPRLLPATGVEAGVPPAWSPAQPCPVSPRRGPYSHLSLGGVGGAGDAELMQAALGALHLLHNEHLRGGQADTQR